MRASPIYLIALLLIMPVASAQLGNMSHSSESKNQHDTENKSTELNTVIYPTNNIVDMLENGRTVDICGYTQSGQRGDCPTNSAPREYYVRYEVPLNTSLVNSAVLGNEWCSRWRTLVRLLMLMLM